MARAERKKQPAHLLPGRVVRLFGMRRSGNHAIINWLQRNAPEGRSVFLNNCRAGRDPIRGHRSLDVFVDGALAKFGADTPLQECFDAAGPMPTTFVSFEDVVPLAGDGPMDPLFPNAPDGEVVVIIYRSFLNWSASLLQKILGNDGYGPVARARIMNAACGGYQTALDRVSDGGARGFVAICYDEWFSSDVYRAKILEQLSFENRDNSRGAVQRYGGGSSFQGKAAKVEELQIDKRSEQLADHPEYLTFLWTASHDISFMDALSQHFPADARRLLALAESAQLWLTLPKSVPA